MMTDKEKAPDTSYAEPLNLALQILGRVAAFESRSGSRVDQLEGLLNEFCSLGIWGTAAYYALGVGFPNPSGEVEAWGEAAPKKNTPGPPPISEVFYDFVHSILCSGRAKFQSVSPDGLSDETGIRSQIGFAVKRAGEAVGAVALVSREIWEPPPGLLSVLELAGEQLGTQLELADLRRELKEEVRAKQGLESSFGLMNTIIENAPAGFAFVGPDFRYVRVNQALATLNGKSIEEHIGKTIEEVVPHIWCQVKGFFREVRSTGKPLLNREVKRLDLDQPGSEKLFLANYFPVHGEKNVFLGIGAVVVDITEKKRAQEELKKLASDLQKSNSALEEFGYVVSHDLKEPLRMVNSYLRILNERSQDWMDRECQEFIGFARRGACRMSMMVDDLLRYSRLGGQNPSLSIQNTSDVLNDVLENVRDQLNAVQAEVITESLPSVKADRSQLMQVFQNLVCNALKFRRDVPPRIRVSAREFGKEFIFSIADNGRGIDEIMLEQIFAVFQRAHRDPETPGDGIGLAICRRIIELHGGRIWAESRLGEGSTFFFTLPRPE